MTPGASHMHADVAIVGSGFGGALAALALRRLGRSVVLLERARHPRFAIGESSTPLANLLLEEFADRYSFPRLRALSKWGTWQAAHPHIACGLKRGFSFFHHEPGLTFAEDASHQRQLLVAASPNETVADTHWYRPDFDHFLVQEAEREGVVYLDEVELTETDPGTDDVVVRGSRHQARVTVSARFLIDATGPRSFLQRALGLVEAPPRWLRPTEALYAHFTGVGRWDVVRPPGEPPPFPIDDAALHHVFPGGWIWVLRFNNGLTSAGAAVEAGLARELRLDEGAPAWPRLLAMVPSVREQFAAAAPVTGFTHLPRVAFRSATMTGSRWALLPGAAGVIDPLLSTGFPLNLLGVHRLVELIDQTWTEPEQVRMAALDSYARQTQAELDATEQLVAALYASFSDFALFKRLSLLYFAAAGFSETMRRLGRPERAPGFLLCNDPVFSREFEACAAIARTQPIGETRRHLMARIDRAIAPIDVAGLLDSARRDWYPMDVRDLLAAAPGLGVPVAEARAMLARCGLPAQ